VSALPGRVFSTCMLLAGCMLLSLVLLARAEMNAMRAIVRRWWP
jgi:hypothetical protein